MATQYEEDLARVKKDGMALEHIKNQTPEMCLGAVKQDGRSLQFIKEQTPDKVNPNNPEHKPFYDLGWRNGDLSRICMVAVQQNGWALRNVKEKNQEICLAAVKQDGWALIYIKDLHSIADEIDESTIVEGLKSDLKKVVLAYQKLIKIREANAMANRINKTISHSVNPAIKKIKL